MGSRVFTLHVPKATIARCTVHRRSGGKSILGGYLHSNAGVFSDRGVLGRQGRDTDASNGEVGAERQVLGPASGLVFRSKALSGLRGARREGICCVSGVSWYTLGPAAFGFVPTSFS